MCAPPSRHFIIKKSQCFTGMPAQYVGVFDYVQCNFVIAYLIRNIKAENIIRVPRAHPGAWDADCTRPRAWNADFKIRCWSSSDRSDPDVEDEKIKSTDLYDLAATLVHIITTNQLQGHGNHGGGTRSRHEEWDILLPQDDK